MNSLDKGYLITLEGIEGAGKSGHAQFVAEQLQQAGKEILLTREPGGTDLGEKIRKILLEKLEKGTTPMSTATELLLMFAARVEHIQKIIMPAMAAGKIVICDRFIDSSYAYQGGGRGIPEQHIKQLEQWIFSAVAAELRPNLTLLLDLSVQTGLLRNTGNSDGQTDMFEVDRFDSISDIDGFMHNVRQCFLNIAQDEPDRVIIIDAEQNIEKVQDMILNALKDRGLCS